MLTEFDKLVRQRNALKEWWKLGQKICGHGGEYHDLRVVVPMPTMVAYCGQAYAGAKNYHDAPGFFFEAVKEELNAQSSAIAKAAYEKELDRLNKEIEKHRNAVLKELETD